jgi:hypothetical protein
MQSIVNRESTRRQWVVVICDDQVSSRCSYVLQIANSKSLQRNDAIKSNYRSREYPVGRQMEEGEGWRVNKIKNTRNHERYLATILFAHWDLRDPPWDVQTDAYLLTTLLKSVWTKTKQSGPDGHQHRCFSRNQGTGKFLRLFILLDQLTPWRPQLL